jgi:uncharacterized protein
LTLYLDSSALVKRYVAEDGSDEVRAAMEAADICSACQVGFVETVRAVARAEGDRALERVEDDWKAFDLADVDQALADRAAQVALSSGLRALDALHLAAALELPDDNPVFATWDARLHRAAREQGLRTLPASL